jgi:Leucine-rich repeat (LRR) protein
MEVFILNSNEVSEQKDEARKLGGEWNGKIKIRENAGIKKVVVGPLEKYLAEEVKWLDFNQNPIEIVEGEEEMKKMKNVRRIELTSCRLTCISWLMNFGSLEEEDVSLDVLHDLST